MPLGHFVTTNASQLTSYELCISSMVMLAANMSAVKEQDARLNPEAADTCTGLYWLGTDTDRPLQTCLPSTTS